jgi:hypothetical protein
MGNAIRVLAFAAVMFVGGVIGASAPVGVCVGIWRYECVESLIGPSGDRGHPAFWAFLALVVPSGLLAIVGTMTICLCVYHVFPGLAPETDPAGRRVEAMICRLERRLAVAWGRNIRRRLRRLDEARAARAKKNPAGDRAWEDDLA